MPTWNDTKGWTGGNDRTLYAFTDTRTGRVVVRPVYDTRGIGPAATVRVATRTEALEQWQNPLHPGWTVAA